MFLLPVAALAMASCSSSEDVAQNVQTPSQELKFFPAVEGTTRGAIETTASISKFYVYADGDLKDAITEGSNYSAAWQAVEKNGSSWELKGQKLWWAKDDDFTPNKVAEGAFTAFANALNSEGVEMTAADATAADAIKKLVNVTVPTDLSKQTDLVVAYNAGKRTDFISGVPLHFRHALSQIVVNATYANDAEASTDQFPELVVKVKSIKFAYLKNTATLSLPTASTAAGKTYEPVWAGASGTEVFASKPAAEVTLASAAQFIDDSEAGNPLLLMPQTTAATTSLVSGSVDGAYLMVEVDINKKSDNSNVYPQANYTGNDGTGYAWIAVPVDIAWKGGYKYTYTLNFSNIACGKAAPGATAGTEAANEGVAENNPVISGVRTPVNFLVTVEEAWIDGGSFTPAM